MRPNPWPKAFTRAVWPKPRGFTGLASILFLHRSLPQSVQRGRIPTRLTFFGNANNRSSRCSNLANSKSTASHPMKAEPLVARVLLYRNHSSNDNLRSNPRVSKAHQRHEPFSCRPSCRTLSSELPLSLVHHSPFWVLHPHQSSGSKNIRQVGRRAKFRVRPKSRRADIRTRACPMYVCMYVRLFVFMYVPV